MELAARRPNRIKKPVEPAHSDRRIFVSAKSARIQFFGALGLYLLWVGVLVALAVASGERPSESRNRAAPAVAPAAPEQPND